MKKKWLIGLLGAICALLTVGATACRTPSGDSGGNGGGQTPAVPTKLTAPTVVLAEDTAMWSANALAEKFEISIDGTLSFLENSITSKQLMDGQTFKIRAVGDGTNYSTSNWSNSVTYLENANSPDVGSTYTINWKNGDAVLETDENVAYGTIPTYDGEEPTKDADAQYTYEFSGWSPEVSAVTGSVTYQAQFSQVIRSYTVTFYAEDGETLLDTVVVEYGSNAVYTQATPSKRPTAEYTYVFEKWVTTQGGTIADDLTNVTGDRCVYASFKAFVRTVTVYVVPNNADYGAVSLSVLNNVPYGAEIAVSENTVTINGQIVTAQATAATAQYTYTFVDWTTDATVGNDTTITANFSRSINAYTVTWKNGETVLEEDKNVAYGMTPVYNGKIPTKEADNENVYTFSGWTPAISSVVEDAVYTAEFTSTANKHAVIYYDDDGETELGRVVVNHGETAIYPNALPTKAATEENTFTFEKWVKEIGGEEEAIFENITVDTNVYAKYTAAIRKYTVTFCDWDGTVLSQVEVSYGEAATAPSGLERDGYRFDGWDAAYDSITENIIVSAKYQLEVEVQFIDYNSNIIYSKFIDQGSDFTDIPADPTRQGYIFIGWSTNTFTNIIEDLIVYAQYTRAYRVSFIDYDDTVLKTENVRVGFAATPPTNPQREGFDFTGWDVEFDNVVSDLIVTATYQIKRYTVTFVGPNGDVISVASNIKHGFSATLPEVKDVYFDWSALKGYRFTRWSGSYQNVTENETVTAIYEEEITEPIIVVRSTTVSSGTIDVPIKVYVCNTQRFYGISLDITFDNALQLGGAISIDVHNTFGTANKDYTSNLTDEGKYELKWTNGNGVDPSKFSGPITLLTFNFKLDEFQNAGDYIVDILESTYIINENLAKVTPVVISGVVTLNR